MLAERGAQTIGELKCALPLAYAVTLRLVPVPSARSAVMVVLMVLAGVEFTRRPSLASPCVAVKTAPAEKLGKPFVCRLTQACA